ncbi:MAG: M13 family metallopeptidase [Gammaproteobacteria bacterium]|nr:MAG: M13 family metallopeptidase [Gammaproteobacteria bacterium]
MTRKQRLLAVALSCAIVAIAAAASTTQVTHGIDLAGIDRAVAPGDDFFAYANGTWDKSAEIPADRSSWGVSGELTEKTNQQVRELLEGAASGTAAPGSNAQKVGDFYASYMGEAAIEAKGIAPLKPEFTRIAAIKDAHSLSAYLGSMLRADVDALNNTNFYTPNLFGVWITQAFDDPKRNVPYLLQGGLGMPDRDYYVTESPRMAELRSKYRAHVAAVLKLAGVAEAEAKAERIFALETKIAKAHWSRVDSEDVHKADNPWKRSDFAVKAPGLDWDAYFAAAHLDHQNDFIAWQASAITGLAALVGSEPVEIWKDYLALRLIEGHANVLPKAFVDENFAFYGTALSGTPKIRDRWKRAVGATSSALGEAVGQIYVAKYFPPSSKAKIEAMVQDLTRAFHARVEKLAWMSPKTKQRALEKLATLKVGVGYPDKWRDYSALKIVRGDAFGNALRAEEFEYRRNLAKLGKAPDRGEWVMVPHLVNAVNLPIANALNFPAAYLQPPLFDPAVDAATNYAAVGTTIGHEISHSFDDQGSQFDAQGHLANWWTDEDRAHFEHAAAQLVAQFDAYKPFPDLAENGKQTLGENIADLGGLAAAYDAYRLALHGKPDVVVDGLSGDARFFLSYAQHWRTKMREPAMRQAIVTDGHALPMYRADTVRNLDAWYAAFEIKPEQKLYLAPKDRVQVW